MTERAPIRPEAECEAEREAGPVPGRRAFLRSAALAALALPAAPLAARAGAAFDPVLAGRPASGATVRRLGPHFLVNGWVLTRADLDALGIRPA